MVRSSSDHKPLASRPSATPYTVIIQEDHSLMKSGWNTALTILPILILSILKSCPKKQPALLSVPIEDMSHDR